MDILAFFDSMHLDIIIIVLVIAGGFWAKTYLDGWTHIRIGKWQPAFSNAWKTLIIGTVFAAIYVFILRITTGLPKDTYLRIFYSYVFATSFYELILGPFVVWVKSKLPSAN